MILKNKIVKNAGWLIGGRLVQTIFGFVIMLLTARYLGPSNYGLISYASSIVTFVAPIMYLGINSVLVQEVINNPKQEGEVIGSSIVMSFLSSLVCVVGVTAFSYIANPGEKTTTIVCFLYSLLLVFQAIDLIQYWFQAKLKSKYTAVITLIAYLIVSAYKIYLLVSQSSVEWFAISHAVDYMLIATGLIFTYKKLGGAKIKFSREIAKQILSKSRYYIVSSMMVAIFAHTDRIMIKMMIGSEAVGFYSAAAGCAGATSFVFAAIIDSVRPVILEAKKKSQKSFENHTVSLYSIIIWLAIAQSVFMTIFAKPIINILYGSKYLAAVSTLQLVVWYTTFSYMGSVRNIWILGEDKHKYLWIINAVGALTNVVLNFILISFYGINGAAIASVITQFFTNFVLGFILRPISYNNNLAMRGFNVKNILTLIKEVKI